MAAVSLVQLAASDLQFFLYYYPYHFRYHTARKELATLSLRLSAWTKSYMLLLSTRLRRILKRDTLLQCNLELHNFGRYSYD